MAVKTPEETTSKTMVPAQKQAVAGAESTRPGRVYTPPVDILETEAEIVIYADMPGVTPQSLDVDLRENVLTIEGHVPASPSEGEVLLREYESGSFYRQFRLSNAIDQARIDATLSDGVLRLKLPKAEAVRPRTIQVQSS
jgi:HSP20 family protein